MNSIVEAMHIIANDRHKKESCIMSGDPIRIDCITGANVQVGHGNRQVFIINGEWVERPSFDDLVAHLREVAKFGDYARWADMLSSEAGERDYYVDLKATLPQRLALHSKRVDGDEDSGQDLLKALAGERRAVILGEPGSGKTTALERLAWATAAGSLATAETGILHIPVFVPLRDYRENETWTSLIRAALNRHVVLGLPTDLSVEVLMHQPNLEFVFLLDGLNEIPRKSSDGPNGPNAIARHLDQHPRHALYVTCRSADFDDENQTPAGASVWEVQPLRDDIRHWGDEQGQSDVRAYLRRHFPSETAAKRLYDRIRADERLRDAARRPLLLRMLKDAGMAAGIEGELPGNRAELVRRFVGSKAALGRVPKSLRYRADHCLEHIGWRLQNDLRRLEIDEKDLQATLSAVRRERDWDETPDRLRQLLQWSGLLVEEYGSASSANIRFKLMHQLVQEYAAAAHLAQKTDAAERLAVLAQDEWHREMCILALGLRRDLHTPDYLQRLMATPSVDLRVRVEAAQILAIAGDPRFKSTAVGGVTVILPHMVPIPSGIAVLGGEDPDADPKELPACEVEVTAFDMGRYPVTNAEYGCFIDAKGYEDLSLWTPAGQAWLQETLDMDAETLKDTREHYAWLHADIQAALDYWKRTGENYTEEEEDEWRERASWSEERFIEYYRMTTVGKVRSKPVWWDDLRLNRPTQPVVGVNVFEAMAYAAWLSRITGDHYTLPTEPQWEWAARRCAPGGPDRRYPWGDEWDPKHCNNAGSRLGGPSPVGIYPHGVTRDAQGLSDMAGNVYEWTLSLYWRYPYVPTDGREGSLVEGMRAIRGGSWYMGSKMTRCAARYRYEPAGNDNDIGFRLVRSSSHVS